MVVGGVVGVVVVGVVVVGVVVVGVVVVGVVVVGWGVVFSGCVVVGGGGEGVFGGTIRKYFSIWNSLINYLFDRS